MKLVISGKTDVGIVRKNNEDNLYISENDGLLVVADGMGGHASGEVASKITVDMMRDYFNAVKEGHQLQIGPYQDDLSEPTNRLGSAIRLANQAIYEAAKDNPLWYGMGTTIAAVLITGNRLSIAHVGDSRVYLIRAGSMEQLTDDHSFVSEQVKREIISSEQAKASAMKNVLTRALGVHPEVEVDLDEISLFDGDMLVLCTDGLTGMVDDDEIFAIANTLHNPAMACEDLVSRANQNGGKDNITVIIAEIEKKKGWLYRLLHFKEWFRR
ncbi:MAG TPA: Stp1/IreP family PP2C-type Ser/Thr phosphatase [Syntrophorhabdaceae bacterium]|nr:Stp1/IreP family PP2C-type Ser/Thr phosphatase [Syntrophorhabdaceae bacterium]HQM81010.1 Stp1/IreP family PP2C-type Ser/Thr phosphatase [Syntrophorhabdaceae bacterium]